MSWIGPIFLYSLCSLFVSSWISSQVSVFLRSATSKHLLDFQGFPIRWFSSSISHLVPRVFCTRIRFFKIRISQAVPTISIEVFELVIAILRHHEVCEKTSIGKFGFTFFTVYFVTSVFTENLKTKERPLTVHPPPPSHSVHVQDDCIDTETIGTRIIRVDCEHAISVELVWLGTLHIFKLLVLLLPMWFQCTTTKVVVFVVGMEA